MKTYYSKHFTIADNGHLQMDGVDLIEVAKQYGTPAYVMSESQLRFIAVVKSRQFSRSWLSLIT